MNPLVRNMIPKDQIFISSALAGSSIGIGIKIVSVFLVLFHLFLIVALK